MGLAAKSKKSIHTNTSDNESPKPEYETAAMLGFVLLVCSFVSGAFFQRIFNFPFAW